jgi:Zn-finger nucleic acid-binding protein
MTTLPICIKCNKHLKIGYNLSDLGYCPDCTGVWIKDFIKMHRPRRRKVRA